MTHLPMSGEKGYREAVNAIHAAITEGNPCVQNMRKMAPRSLRQAPTTQHKTAPKCVGVIYQSSQTGRRSRVVRIGQSSPEAQCPSYNKEVIGSLLVEAEMAEEMRQERSLTLTLTPP